MESTDNFGTTFLSPMMRYVPQGKAGAPHFCYGDGAVLVYNMGQRTSPYVTNGYMMRLLANRNTENYLYVYIAVYVYYDIQWRKYRLSFLPLLTRSLEEPWNNLVPGTGHIPIKYNLEYTDEVDRILMVIDHDLVKTYNRMRDSVLVYINTGEIFSF